ncbi:hypothetical protein [Streptomyces sp. NRRL S-350]|uniref:hypothetical protein n=1 Tax=Streptomyces sp. NRRL S-350 TaxID=1463902 RepID=UPI0004C274CF|nr:hypothetical protein [Streptomyces sp. NRRL S-350]
MALVESILPIMAETAPDAGLCPACKLFDGMDAQYPGKPTILRKVAKWRAQHVDDGECLAVRGDG